MAIPYYEIVGPLEIAIDEYFNFFLHIANTEYNGSDLFKILKKVYVGFLESHFNKK